MVVRSTRSRPHDEAPGGVGGDAARAPHGAAASAAPTAPPGVPDAGRRALLTIGGRVATWYLAGIAVATVLSPPPADDRVRWLIAVTLLAAAATGIVGAITRPIGVRTALIFAASTALAGLALTAVHPSLGGRDVQILVGSTASAAAAGAALSWGPPSGLVATTWVLAGAAGLLHALEGRLDAPTFATTLAGGLLGVTASGFLRRGYIVTQRALAAAEEAVATRAVAAARWRARRGEIRVLHDTVLSTLSLVAQGGQGVDAAGLRADCRDQARLLRDADLRTTGAAPAGEPAASDITRPVADPFDADPFDADPFEQVRRRWAARSLEVRLYGTVEARGLAGVGPAASAALLGAVEECLENVRRHAGVAVATVSVMRSGTQVQCTVTDEGQGFDATDPTRRRIGLEDSVMGRIEEAGGGVRVWSAPGQGTSVALWVPLA